MPVVETCSSCGGHVVPAGLAAPPSGRSPQALLGPGPEPLPLPASPPFSFREETPPTRDSWPLTSSAKSFHPDNPTTSPDPHGAEAPEPGVSCSLPLGCAPWAAASSRCCMFLGDPSAALVASEAPVPGGGDGGGLTWELGAQRRGGSERLGRGGRGSVRLQLPVVDPVALEQPVQALVPWGLQGEGHVARSHSQPPGGT